MIWENVSLKNHLKGHIFYMAAFAKPFSLKSPSTWHLASLFFCKDKRKLECFILNNALNMWQKGFCSLHFHSQAFSYYCPVTVVSCLTLCGLERFPQPPGTDKRGSYDLRGFVCQILALTLVLSLPCCRTCCLISSAWAGLFTCDHYVIIHFMEPH